jgi:microcystin-dependent protein
MAMPPLVFRQFFDDEGAPLADGRLYTYVTGTTTPLATYSNAALSVENANPIVLDDSGRCDLYLAAPPTAYRFRLEDSDGALVDEQDDVVGMTAPLEGDFVPIEGDVTMTGLFELSGNATANLNPVPLQQVNTLIAAAADSLEDVAAAAVPVGTVALWLTGSPPTNWLHLNGAAVSRTTYADLFALWGTAFGTGDGSTTFNLPDVRGEFPRFWDATRGVDSGRAIATAQTDLVKTHTHGVETGRAVADGNVAQADGGLTENGDSFPFTFTSDEGGATTGAENRPRNFSFMGIVKAL